MKKFQFGSLIMFCGDMEQELLWQFRLMTKEIMNLLKKFNLQITQVINGDKIDEVAYEGDGIHINSGFINDLNKEDAINKMNNWLEENKVGKAAVNYKLRDWLFSRQRYWGEPIPLYKDKEGNAYPVSESELPLELPKTEKYKPAGDGKSPLANIREWVEFEGEDGKKIF